MSPKNPRSTRARAAAPKSAGAAKPASGKPSRREPIAAALAPATPRSARDSRRERREPRERPERAPKPSLAASAPDAGVAVPIPAAWLKLGVPAAWVIGSLVIGAVRGPALALLALAAGTLLGAIAVFWASVRTFFGATPLTGADAYAVGAPRAEEEQKRAVLRALRDLEFEKSVGKISEDDYRALSSKLRTQAKNLLRSIDAAEGPERERALARAKERLARAGLEHALERYEKPSPTSAPTSAPVASGEPTSAGPSTRSRKRAADDREFGERSVQALRATLRGQSAPAVAPSDVAPLRARRSLRTQALVEWTCTACAAHNEAETRFCSACGKRRPEESLPPAVGDSAAAPLPSIPRMPAVPRAVIAKPPAPPKSVPSVPSAPSPEEFLDDVDLEARESIAPPRNTPSPPSTRATKSGATR